MGWLFKHILFPLLSINNNIYAFLSGILIALSTNMFSTLCIEKGKLSERWHIYLASLLFVIAGGTCIYLATKMTPFQNYIYNQHIKNSEERETVIKDVISKNPWTWIVAFIIMFGTLIAGMTFLIIYYNVK